MYDDIMMTVIDIMQDLTDLPIRRASLPSENGIAFEKATSDTVTTCLDRSTLEELPCVLNCKHADLAVAQQTLDRIHIKLTRLPAYPRNERWQIYSIETIAAPSQIGREPNGQWLVGSSIRIKVYNKESAF